MPMNRQRSLPVSDWTDPKVASLPPEVRVTAFGLRMYADDEGREAVRLRPMVAEIFEHDDSMTATAMQDHLLLLDEAGWLRLYTADGISLYQVRVWPPVQHPSPSRLPPPPGFMKPSRGSQETFMAVARAREGERASECAGASEWVGEPGAASERGGPAPGAPPDDSPRPPSPFCSRHLPYGTEEACGPCRTARMAHDIWQEAFRRAPLPAPAPPPGPEHVEFIDEHGRIETT